MGFKRKRSVDDSPLSASSAGVVTTPEAQSPTPLPQNYNGAMDIDVDAMTRGNVWDFMSANRVKNSDWGNRTRKRFRDNRPDESEIHANTLNKLFAAQRNHAHASPIPSDQLSLQEPTPSTAKPQKSTLHSFWKQLPAPPSQASTSLAVQPPQMTSSMARCDDCDATLQDNGVMEMDVDMDVDVLVEGQPFACTDCGKNVCATCAVVSARRHCLQCAIRGRNSRRWW